MTELIQKIQKANGLIDKLNEGSFDVEQRKEDRVDFNDFIDERGSEKKRKEDATVN